MTDYHHIKFGLIWMKGSKVTEGGAESAPQVENVLKRPGEIGLREGQSETCLILRTVKFFFLIYKRNETLTS